MKIARGDLLWLRGAGDTARIARTFHEMDFGAHRIPHQRIDGKNHRLADHAVNQQLMFRRIDVGRPIVIAHIMQARGRDRAFEILQRSAR